MENILVTVAVCSFNQDQFVRSAIHSILNQTYKKIELIIVNDGSTDDTKKIIEEFKERANIINKINGGQASSYNAAINIATGKIIFFLDADDFYYPQTIERVVNVMSDSGAVKAHFFLDCVNEYDEPLSLRTPRLLSSGFMHDKIINEGWLYYSAPGSGNAYDTATLKQIGALPESIDDKHGADFFLIHACSLYGEIVSVHETLAAYRVLKVESARNSVVFGNSHTTKREPHTQINRELMLLSWMNKLTSNQIQHSRLVSIPTSKLKLASVYLLPRQSFFKKVLWQYFFELLVAVKVDRDRSFLDKTLIVVWMFACLVTPLSLRKSLVRKACNPLSR